MVEKLDAEISGFSKKLDTAEQHNLKRARASNVVLSPSLSGLPPDAILPHLYLNERTFFAGPKAAFDLCRTQLVEKGEVSRKKIDNSLVHLDGIENPFDNIDLLKEVLSDEYIDRDIGYQIESCAAGLLTQSPEAKKLEKSFDNGTLDVFPMAAPYFMMGQIWRPMAYRARYLTKRLPELSAGYASMDTYEVDVQDASFHFGSRDSQVFRDGLKNETHIPRIDHRGYILGILASSLSGLMMQERKSKAAKPDVDWDGSVAASSVLEEIADRLYKDPYYISEKELAADVGSKFLDLLAHTAVSPFWTGAKGLIGNIPLPFIPNPVGLYTAYESYAEKRTLNKEFGWLLFFVNISKALPYFQRETVPQIPNVRRINFRDDIVHTIAASWVLNKRTYTLHRSNCAHLKRVGRSDARLFLDYLGNWPRIEARKCKSCCA